MYTTKGNKSWMYYYESGFDLIARQKYFLGGQGTRISFLRLAPNSKLIHQKCDVYHVVITVHRKDKDDDISMRT